MKPKHIETLREGEMQTGQERAGEPEVSDALIHIRIGLPASTSVMKDAIVTIRSTRADSGRDASSMCALSIEDAQAFVREVLMRVLKQVGELAPNVFFIGKTPRKKICVGCMHATAWLPVLVPPVRQDTFAQVSEILISALSKCDYGAEVEWHEV